MVELQSLLLSNRGAAVVTSTATAIVHVRSYFAEERRKAHEPKRR